MTGGLRSAPPEALDDDPPVRRCADPVGPPRVSCFATVGEALEVMRDRGTDLLLVEDPGGGTRTIAEVDLLRRIAAPRPGRRARREPVGRLAHPILRLDAGSRCRAAALRVLDGNARLAVLVAEDGVVGFVSAEAILRLLAGVGR